MADDISKAIASLHTGLENLGIAISKAGGTGGSSPLVGGGGGYYGGGDIKGAGHLADEKLLNKLQEERFKYSKWTQNEYAKTLRIKERIEKIEEEGEKLAIKKQEIDTETLIIANKKKQISIQEKKFKKETNLTDKKKAKDKLDELKVEKVESQKKKKDAEGVVRNQNKIWQREQMATRASIGLDMVKTKAKEKAIGVINNASSSLLDYIKNTISSAFEQDSIMSKLAANYALTKTESFALKQNILNASMQTAAWGVNTEDLVKMQSTYTDEIGRSVMLGEEGMVSLAKMGVATGIGAEGAAQMAGEMELFGLSAESAAASVENLMQSSKISGVSTSVATKKLNDNLKISNSYTFKNGVQGVQDMTIYSTKFRLNMQSIATFADKISNPEGAIETAASLQVLGGSFAQMADPLKMLDQGINDMEGLTQTYKKMLDGVAKINKQTGEVSVGGYDRLRVKAAAAAMGVSFDEMMESARTIAKRSAIEADVNINPNIKGGNEETKNMIASLAEFNKKTGGFQISVGGKTKMVAELSKEDIDTLQPKDQAINLQTIAESTLGLTDFLKNSLNQLTQSLMPTLIGYVQGIYDFVKPIIDKFTGGATGAEGQAKMGDKIKGSAIGAGIGAMVGLAGGIGLGIMTGAGFGAIPTLMQAGAISGGLIGAKVSGNDVILPSGGGNPIFLNSKDDVFAMKPGGAIANAVTPAKSGESSLSNMGDIANAVTPAKSGESSLSNMGDIGSTLFAKASPNPVGVISPNQDINKIYGGVSNPQNCGYNSGNGNSNIGGSISHNIKGSISLVGGNSSTKISATELVKDQQFLKELTRLIGNQTNRDSNGGRYSGPLTNDSF